MKRMLCMLLTAIMMLTLACPVMAEETALRESLVMVENGDWWGLDVTQLDGSATAQGLIGDSLVTVDAAGNMLPGIASDVKVSEDGLTITMTIPEGMYYYNGEQVEPEDVVASIERIKTVSPFGSQVACIETMEVSGRDVIMHLSAFSFDLATALGGSFITIMDKDEIEAKTDDELLWDCHPYGLYSIKEYVQGSHVTVTRNPGYKTYNPYVENKGPALIEEITVRFITEEFTVAQEANLGNVDYIVSMSPNGAAQVTSADMAQTKISGTPQINYLEFNLDDPVTGDYNVRKAIALAIDREALAEQCNGSIVPAYSFVLDSVFNHNAEWAEYYKANFCNNKEEAIRLLEESGWKDTDGDGIRDKDGQPLSLQFISSNIESPDTIVAQALQIQMMDIGVWLQIDFHEDSYHYEVLENGEFQLGMERFGWSEPIMLLQWAFCWPNNLEYAGGLDNYMGIIDQMAKNPNADERTALVYECEKILGETIIDVPLFDTTSIVVAEAGLTHPVYLDNGACYFNDMH